MKGSRTKEKIVGSALSFVSEYGLNAITIGGIAERVGISKGGLCAHFASKESLQIGVLRAAQELARRAVFENPSRQTDRVGELVEFFHRWTAWATRSGLPGGCPFVAAVFEFDDLDGPIRDELLAIQGDFFVRVFALVQAAVDSGEFESATDAAQVVWEVVALYNGHHVAQRFLCDSTADQRAKTAFDGLIARHRIAVASTTRSQANQTRQALRGRDERPYRPVGVARVWRDRVDRTGHCGHVNLSSARNGRTVDTTEHGAVRVANCVTNGYGMASLVVPALVVIWQGSHTFGAHDGYRSRLGQA